MRHISSAFRSRSRSISLMNALRTIDGDDLHVARRGSQLLVGRRDADDLGRPRRQLLQHRSRVRRSRIGRRFSRSWSRFL